MPRIPYQPLDLAEPRELVEAIRLRRGGALSNLDRLLLHSPPLASGWNAFLGTVRTKLALSPKLREIAMCTVAILNHAEYEFYHHAPEFIKAGGTPEQVEALRQIEDAVSNDVLFDESERAAMQLTIEMTRDVKVSDRTMKNVETVLGHYQLVVELVATIATYNMVSRFLVAFDVNPENKE